MYNAYLPFFFDLKLTVGFKRSISKHMTNLRK